MDFRTPLLVILNARKVFIWLLVSNKLPSFLFNSSTLCAFFISRFPDSSMQWDMTQFQVDYGPSLGNLWTWPGQISMLKLPMVIYFSDRIVKHPTKMDWNQEQKENKFRNLPFWKSKLLIRLSKDSRIYRKKDDVRVICVTSPETRPLSISSVFSDLYNRALGRPWKLFRDFRIALNNFCAWYSSDLSAIK